MALPECRVLSFEPLASEASVFHAVLDSEPRVVLHQVALADRPGEHDFVVSVSRDSSSLLPPSVLQTSSFPGTEVSHTETVSVRTLDEYLPSFRDFTRGLLKLDVQGAELKVLLGAAQALRHFEYVYCEVSFVEFYEQQPLAAEVVEYLRGEGFDLAGIGGVQRVGGSVVQVDALFSRSAR